MPEEEVRYIHNLVLYGNFTLSPLTLSKYEIESDTSGLVFHKYKCDDGGGTNVPMFVKPTLKDSLVLTALGRMLNHHFLKNNFDPENCFGLRMRRALFYSTLCSVGAVKRLSKLDLQKYLNRINRESLMLNLSHIVKDVAILELVGSFLSSPIINENGRQLNLTVEGELAEGRGIPPAGLFTNVLLHFFLT